MSDKTQEALDASQKVLYTVSTVTNQVYKVDKVDAEGERRADER
jgi:hypothetical protein